MAIIRRQKFNNDCGPTCFANALNLLGYDIKIGKANKLCNLQKDGTDSNDLFQAFEKYGFLGKEKIYYTEKNAWKWILQDTKNGLPVILSVDNDSHWILVLRVGRKNAQILDPGDDGPVKVSRKKLIERWHTFEDRRPNPKFMGLTFEPFKDKSIKAVEMRQMLIESVDVR